MEAVTLAHTSTIVHLRMTRTTMIVLECVVLDATALGLFVVIVVTILRLWTPDYWYLLLHVL